jgi:hypothetical protein
MFEIDLEYVCVGFCLLLQRSERGISHQRSLDPSAFDSISAMAPQCFGGWGVGLIVDWIPGGQVRVATQRSFCLVLLKGYWIADEQLQDTSSYSVRIVSNMASSGSRVSADQGYQPIASPPIL